ncbi:E3 ubiquitin-protein ligase TRIM71-like [Oopsacas minuta]|uniref:E3 ubiquitin-protein ligase TRIM71-like n=1 Tax=Oopsacas minuta TaxID=111878 RepID=A0AAV7K446_9METZ|nr:E3 ubiquitin-protein ligase TRIM71-like [Oopsacas minuta]
MAFENPKIDFLEQINNTRESIKNRFKISREALSAREQILLDNIDRIESEYNQNAQLQAELSESLSSIVFSSIEKLKANELSDTREEVTSLLDSKLTKLAAETDFQIEFEWNNLFETEIEQLGNILLNGQTNLSTLRTFPLQVKPVIPDYKIKQLPTSYCCKKISNQKAPGEFNSPKSIAIHYKSERIYVADRENNVVQVFRCDTGDYLFMFGNKMNKPRGICIFQDKVFVTQLFDHCINVYSLEGILIQSVGSHGSGEVQFSYPQGLDVSIRNLNVYVCEYGNNRVQILTPDLKFHSMLGIGIFHRTRDIKITRDRIIVLDESDPCVFLFNSDHNIINRLITRGDAKQTMNPVSFDIDRDYNIILSDYSNHCVYVFNIDGEQIHKFGKYGQGIGEFTNPWGVALDNKGHIIVVCEKTTACLQFF